jgi:protein ImuB
MLEQSRSLIADARASGESTALVLERIAARLGKNRVLRPVLSEDTRMEWTNHWQAADAKPPSTQVRLVPGPQPTWIFKKPLRLDVQAECPLYQGPLQMLLGPQRVEGGWWHRVLDAQGQERHLHVARDYWVARSPYAGVLWIYQERLAPDAQEGKRASWYLHGIFA